jgi:hypothetical protein
MHVYLGYFGSRIFRHTVTESTIFSYYFFVNETCLYLIKQYTGAVRFNQQSVLSPESKRHIGISAAKVVLPSFFIEAELLTFHYVNNLLAQINEQWLIQFTLKPYWHTKVANLSRVQSLRHRPFTICVCCTNERYHRTRERLLCVDQLLRYKLTFLSPYNVKKFYSSVNFKMCLCFKLLIFMIINIMA